MKITMNVLQKNTLEFFDGVIASCCWSSLPHPVPPGERLSWLRARLEEILKTCEQLLLKGKGSFVVE